MAQFLVSADESDWGDAVDVDVVGHEGDDDYSRQLAAEDAATKMFEGENGFEAVKDGDELYVKNVEAGDITRHEISIDWSPVFNAGRAISNEMCP
ncbi:hypothetical protein [Salipiger mucosus]|uniref:Uncharacterized protein n=1 Tax=Salipiger mucosus DSM 16094 TaxID=1123237 RepID=S9QW84_9RHOB|nr:hypothetical protein [Salipiger mucosus]EPX83878.1 hypothetical protein Salmuc_01653 [Salipiger mucosus DSM 16094]